ncbi:site-specific integrase [Paraburkholderia guartelaensis]|uniref:Site-specific integrase n=1 Tax=Paraburkholderia guartelaensis TaxID=2546446 RepID=A0A4V2ZWM6_9BURK|nr:site-specific integrase [Paraburkholderia guartelaensis]TDG10433.1 site-specific integrase [Paraburkholderia guartelaensis]
MRRKIPVDLRQHFNGKAEIVRALGTSDRRDAERLVREASVFIDREFEALRGKPTYKPVTRAEVERAEQVQEASAEEFHEPLDAQEAAHDAREARYLEFASFMARLQNGEARTAPTAAPQPVPAATALPKVRKPATVQRNASEGHLAELVELWAKDRNPEKRTIGIANKVVGRFYDLVGRIPVRDITRANVVAFKNALRAAGQTPVNTDQQLTMLSTLLAWAVNNLKADTNAALGIKVGARQNAKAARIPYDLSMLQKVFSSPVFTEAARPVSGCGEAAYWLPLLALLHGARLEELAQLSPSDVYEETYRDGNGTATAWVVRLTAAGEGQDVKNVPSVRRIPIHAAILERGFLEYVASRKGADRLFDVRPDREGREGASWGKWWGMYLRGTCGVIDPRIAPMHSFRHLWKDLARDAGITEEVSDAITGHAGGSVGRSYGSITYPLAPLVSAMARISVPGLKLP